MFKEDMTSNNSVHRIFDILNKVPSVFPSKEWMINELINKHHIEKSVVLWLATNIIPHVDSEQSPSQPAKELFTWGFNLNTINDLFSNYKQTDMWNFLETYNGKSTIHFIRAGIISLLLLFTKQVGSSTSISKSSSILYNIISNRLSAIYIYKITYYIPMYKYSFFLFFILSR